MFASPVASPHPSRSGVRLRAPLPPATWQSIGLFSGRQSDALRSGSAPLRAGPTSPSRSSSATASGLPDNVPATTGGDGDGDLPVPEQEASAHARVYDDAGSA